MTVLHRRTGFEIELMAPPGSSRRTLAEDLAARHGGRVHPVWHHDSEPSLVPGLGRFLHLTQGFDVRRAGATLVSLVDDVTLLAGLDPRAPATPGWYRLLSDDSRLLALLAAQCDPAAPLETVLDAAAALWRTTPEKLGPAYRLDAPNGATVALAAPQGAERERPCELVTPPLVTDHLLLLEELLEPARALGFTVPHEAAVHLHVDGAPFRSAPALANVIRLFGHWRAPLRTLLGTNPACTRLAPLPAALVALTDGSPGFDELRRVADKSGLTKFYDVNLTQLFRERPIRDTVEIRILPGSIDAGEIINRAALVELLLDRCEEPAPLPLPPDDPAAAVDALMELAAATLADRP